MFDLLAFFFVLFLECPAAFPSSNRLFFNTLTPIYPIRLRFPFHHFTISVRRCSTEWTDLQPSKYFEPQYTWLL